MLSLNKAADYRWAHGKKRLGFLICMLWEIGSLTSSQVLHILGGELNTGYVSNIQALATRCLFWRRVL